MNFIAWKNLIHDKARFIISVLGVSLAILLLFAIKGIALGISDTAVKYADNQEADIFIFQKGVKNMQMTSSFLPAVILDQIKSIDGVNEAEGLYGFPYQYEEKDKKIASYLVAYEKMGGPWKIKEGVQTPKDDQVIVDLAFVKKGGFKIGDSIELLGSTFKIAGISNETNPMGGLFIFANKATMDNVLKSNDTLNMILVKAKPGVDIEKLIDKINRNIPLVNAIKSSKLAENEASMIMELFNPIINAIVLIVLIVSTAFIGLTIYNATLEKVEEYTILKAIGANKMQLFNIVFFQSFAIAFIGSIAGFLLSYLLSQLMFSLMPDITMKISLSLGIGFLWTVPVMALISAYIPLRKIYTIDEADVLRN